MVRSLITIKALTYEPTGGIVAAPTTSLPEDLGGVRNWDYRYCWLRDATIVLEALLRTGYTEEAAGWRDWLGRAIAGSAADVQIMYGVAGERRLAEWMADWLPGYEGSAPVRIGNDAVEPASSSTSTARSSTRSCSGARPGCSFDKHSASLIDALLDFLEQHWAEPDEGIWEVRGPRRHFVHSKVMAWVAFDRADQDGAGQAWSVHREAIWVAGARSGTRSTPRCANAATTPSRGTFTQYYGSETLDAAVLMILGGRLPAAGRRAGRLDRPRRSGAS